MRGGLLRQHGAAMRTFALAGICSMVARAHLRLQAYVKMVAWAHVCLQAYVQMLARRVQQLLQGGRLRGQIRGWGGAGAAHPGKPVPAPRGRGLLLHPRGHAPAPERVGAFSCPPQRAHNPMQGGLNPRTPHRPLTCTQEGAVMPSGSDSLTSSTACGKRVISVRWTGSDGSRYLCARARVCACVCKCKRMPIYEYVRVCVNRKRCICTDVCVCA